ncbi:prepilin-type N-terminal cleavage/methylation domain-containing protein [Exilibacterium tricleocarpae]|uniref:Type II secretion system protein H n=1 Tax=Exilibacterium tricleocarpae TaxID=2591008 RepID=A0A545T1W4_9GAMM|nr:GspH/FimT family protein [Exilibacterium tricleocarpae]TQV71201.1 prepilin-type N-terminal cleavage/methylation domain-containing protein [Exilibacterium tricleocarpae]
MNRETVTKLRGFTLLELLLALAIIAILVSSATPALTHLYRSVQADMARHRLNALLNFSRYTALAHRKTVALCPASDDLACGEDWTNGIVVFVDTDEDGERDDDEEVLRVSPTFESRSKLTWRAFRGKPYLQFTSSGVTRTQNGRFSYCPPSGENSYRRQLIVHKTGRVRYASAKELTGEC